MRVRPIGVLLIASALVAGCGGSESEGGRTTTQTETDRVRTAAETLVRSQDPRTDCRERVTRRFIDEMFRSSVQTCIKSNINAPEQGGKTEVGAIELQGDRARVTLAFAGGNLDGTRGHALFAREQGAWKLDRYDDDMVRAAIDAAVQNIDGGLLSTPAIRSCFTEQTKALSAEEARNFFVLSVSGDPRFRKVGNGLLAKCPEELADVVADKIIDALAKTGERSAAFRRCARRELRFLLGVTGLAKDTLKGNTDWASKAALQGLVVGVNKACSGK
jgi:hypothetical protein